MQHSLSAYYDILDEDNQSFIYRGHYRDELTQTIVYLSESNLKSKKELKKIRKKVPVIMVECFQNIVRHRKETEKERVEDSADFSLTRNIGNNYYIASANLVKSNQVNYLLEQLKKVNKLDKDELKELYLNVLAGGELSEQGGAGLGLIEMAKKSGQKLMFDFNKINDNVSQFYLGVEVQAEKKAQNPQLLEESQQLYDMMKEDDIYLLFKGDFSRESVMPIFQMIENSVQHTKSKKKTKLMLVLIELLQNMSKHGKKHHGHSNGLFMLGQKNERYLLSGGNLVEPQKAKQLQEYIQYLNTLNIEQLNELFKETLLKDEGTEKGGAGLGLIEMARNSIGHNLDIEVKEISNTNTLFVISVTV